MRPSRTITAVLGILKAGAAYVPIEPAWPRARIDFIQEAIGASTIISSLPAGHLSQRFPRGGDPDHPAYVIFTSGSSGSPKAVAVRHRPVINLIDWVNRRFAVAPGDKLLATASIAFDLSVYDIFGTLAAGGTIRIATDAELRDPRRLVRILQEENITFWNSAPAALERLLPLH